jgi:hypothetical protein
MKSLVFLLMLIGFVFITIGVVRSNNHCPPPKIQYRYIPQTFDQQQREEQHLASKYKDMFEKDSPWLSGAVKPKDFNTNEPQDSS